MNPATTYDHLFSPQGTGPEDFCAPGIITFMRGEHVQLKADVLRASGARYAFLGVPFEEGNIGKPGTVEGPRDMRIASHEYFPYWFEYETDLQGEIVDCGDVHIPKVDPSTSHERVYRAVREILAAGVTPILCGGDHSITIPASRALSDHFGSGKAMGYLQLGAHLNMAEAWAGERHANVSTMARVSELSNVAAANVRHVGARNALNPKDWIDLARERGIVFHSINDVFSEGLETVLSNAADSVWNGTDAQYLSIDMNIMDASAAPGVTAPEPGGLDAREIMRAAEILGERPGVGIIDLTELCPVVDVNGTTTKLAACVLLRYLATLAKTRGEHVDPDIRRPTAAE
jgi:agmatinase